MFNKFIFIVFLIIGAAFAPAFAQTGEAAEKAAAIKELIAIINRDNRAEDMVRQMTARFNDLHDATIEELLASETALSASDKAEIKKTLLLENDARIKKFQEKMLVKMQFGEMLNDIAATVYDKHYTFAEIKDLLAFYRTPTGQKTLVVMTPMMSDTMQMTSERLLAKLPEVLEEIKAEERREISEQIKTIKSKPKTR